MSVLNEDTLLENLDFKCARCGADCSKVNALEPELGYLSRATGHEGEFIGPLCSNCYKQIPEQDRVIRKLPETAFLVVIRQDGEGAYVTTEGVPVTYKREATYNDIINGCNQVARDISDAMASQKTANTIVRILSSVNNNKLLIPR